MRVLVDGKTNENKIRFYIVFNSVGLRSPGAYGFLHPEKEQAYFGYALHRYNASAGGGKHGHCKSVNSGL